MPKLLLVGIVERTCLKTVVREIPGITDCFRVKEENKDGKTTVSLFLPHRLLHLLIFGFVADN